jgi:hypothetical protein
MPNIQLKSDTTYQIVIVVFNQGGGVVPATPGDVDSVVSANPTSLGMAVGALAAPAGPYPAGTPTLDLTPLVAESDAGNGGGGIAANLTDTAGLPMSMPYLFDIVKDLTPGSLGLDTTVIVTTPQPTPTAPGP